MILNFDCLYTCWFERFKLITSRGIGHHNFHCKGSMRERTAMMESANWKLLHFTEMLDWRPFRKDTTRDFCACYGFFSFAKRFFSFAKTVCPKHEDLRVMNTNVVNLTRLFLFRLVVKIQSKVTYRRLYLLHHNIVKQWSPYSKSGKPR